MQTDSAIHILNQQKNNKLDNKLLVNRNTPHKASLDFDFVFWTRKWDEWQVNYASEMKEPHTASLDFIFQQHLEDKITWDRNLIRNTQWTKNTHLTLYK